MVFLMFDKSTSVYDEPVGGTAVACGVLKAGVPGLCASTSSILILPRGPVPTTFYKKGTENPCFLPTTQTVWIFLAMDNEGSLTFISIFFSRAALLANGLAKTRDVWVAGCAAGVGDLVWTGGVVVGRGVVVGEGGGDDALSCEKKTLSAKP